MREQSHPINRASMVRRRARLNRRYRALRLHARSARGLFDIAKYPAIRGWLSRVKSQRRHIPIIEGRKGSFASRVDAVRFDRRITGWKPVPLCLTGRMAVSKANAAVPGFLNTKFWNDTKRSPIDRWEWTPARPGFQPAS